MALIATLAAVAVPGPVGSRVPTPFSTPPAEFFDLVAVDASVRGPAMTTQPLDPSAQSEGALDRETSLLEPQRTEAPQGRSDAAQKEATAVKQPRNPWRFDGNVSWYGPGFIGNGTACGQTLTRSLVGVAHRTLPCGTMVTFRNPANGRVVTAPVVDRGPYVSGRKWDLTYGLCKKLDHCYTGSLKWRWG
jgi:rare lipoprotein A (peptidoglycan hydrolase)